MKNRLIFFTPSYIIRNLEFSEALYGNLLSKSYTKRKVLLKRCGVALDIAFDSRTLRTICEDENEAIKELGQTVSGSLKRRLADFHAAMNIHDILVGSPRVCENAIKDYKEMMIDLHDGYYLVFGANHPHNPLDEQGRVDWIKVRRIKILRIERSK